jgi:hypothetical protein
VVVWLQFFRLVRMIVRAVLPLMLVLVLLRIARVGMLVHVLMRMFVFVDVFVLVSVRRLVVGVLVCMSMSAFVLMLVAMIVLTFHWIPPDTPSKLQTKTDMHRAAGRQVEQIILTIQQVFSRRQHVDGSSGDRRSRWVNHRSHPGKRVRGVLRNASAGWLSLRQQTARDNRHENNFGCQHD